MAAFLLRNRKSVSILDSFWKSIDLPTVTCNRSIMASRARLEKAVEEIQRNPFFDKYAQKIAKLQETSPEEFLKRIDEKEQKEKKGILMYLTLKFFSLFFTFLKYLPITNIFFFHPFTFSYPLSEATLTHS